MKHCGHNFLKTGSKRLKREIESDQTTEEHLPPGFPEIKTLILPVKYEKLHSVQGHESDDGVSVGSDKADNSPDNASAEESAAAGPDTLISKYDLPPDAADQNIKENENAHIYGDGDGNNGGVGNDGVNIGGGNYDGGHNGEENYGGVNSGEAAYDGLNNGGVNNNGGNYDGVNNDGGNYDGLNNGGVNNGGGNYGGVNSGGAGYDGMNNDVENNGEESYGGVNNGVMGYGGDGYAKPVDKGYESYDPDASLDENVYTGDYNEGKQTLDVGSDVDVGQYQAECPSVCPARDVMVCARCQHGVFRTFLTTCHMRMFTCHHTDEKLQLVSRRACAVSAPYLAQAGAAPRGRVREPGDRDTALRYLRCRDLYTQRERSTNHKCKFEDSEMNATGPYIVDDNY